MECFYFPDINRQSAMLTISGDDTKHLKANHIDKENVMLTNGSGLSAVALAERTGKNEFTLHITEYLSDYGEEKPYIALALGILGSRDRFEFALEKAVELGVNEFFPLITAHTERNTTNHSRLLAKAIAAMIQSKRSRLPVINSPLNLESLLSQSSDFGRIILADPEGETPCKTGHNGKYLILTGPEGGFSNEELMQINSTSNLMKWRLGGTRLRAETAAIVAIGFVSNFA